MACYPGGKGGAGVAQTIINLMPPHEVYIEPFLGGGSVLLAKLPAVVNIGIDATRASLDQVREACIAGNGGFAGSLAGLNERILPPEPTSPDEVSGSSTNTISDGRRRYPSPNSAGSAGTIRLGDGSSLELRHGCAIAYLETRRWGTGELVYCDPPYVRSTRSGRELYGENEMTDDAHQRLLRCILEIPAMVMISGYESDLYKEALAGWNVVTFQSMTRGGYPKTEWLWFNFPRPTALHDYRYLGSNFRERERIKRKKQRWTARLSGMPLLERQALLSAMQVSWPSPLVGSGVEDRIA